MCRTPIFRRQPRAPRFPAMLPGPFSPPPSALESSNIALRYFPPGLSMGVQGSPLQTNLKPPPSLGAFSPGFSPVYLSFFDRAIPPRLFEFSVGVPRTLIFHRTLLWDMRRGVPPLALIFSYFAQRPDAEDNSLTLVLQPLAVRRLGRGPDTRPNAPLFPPNLFVPPLPNALRVDVKVPRHKHYVTLGWSPS